MKNTYLGALFLLFSIPLCAQTSLSGIVNQYAKVTSIDPCSALLTVSNSAAFNVGDPVLIMQMQGAVIDESNSSSFGNTTELGMAGRYELNEISAVIGMEVYLKYALVNNYDVTGSVQLVAVSSHEEAVITDTVTALPWDGQKGGVVAIQVENTLTFEAPADVSGLGFRGGAVNILASDCNFLTDADGYHYTLTNWRGAPKGEGIARIIPGKEQGRGAQANGGGGGNDHNSGGGGGANVTSAGDGGKQSVSGFGCNGDNPGKGGKLINNITHRIFFGGGGGAGHVNNANVGSPGGNGGGIVIIIAGAIQGNGNTIFANGQTPANGNPSSDGQGGGGAGGSVLINNGDINSELRIEAKGGNGGNASNPSSRCFGPGGGGSGGRLISTATTFADVDLSGGKAGINVNPSSECSNPSNGADDGQDGMQTAFNGIDESGIEPVETQVIMQPQSDTGCESIQVTFEFLIEGTNLSYQWQVDDGSGWTDLEVDPNYAGINSASLTIFSSDASMNGYKYRAFVTGPCTEDIVSLPATLNVIPSPQPDFNYTTMGGGTIQFENTSENALSYFWSFGDGTTSIEANPSHTYDLYGAYNVVLTATNDCGSMTFEQLVFVSAPPQAGFTTDVSSGCAPLAVQFVNQSSFNADSWQWFFPGGIPAASNDENPGVVYTQPGDYEVTLIASNDEGSDTIVVIAAVIVNDVPDVDFETNIDIMEVEFVNLTTNASGGFQWYFGDGTSSTEVSPVHTYDSDGYFDVTLTATNDCGQSSITQTIATGSFPLAAFNADFIGNCAPLTVYYTDQSGGSNLLSYLWEFEGGIPATSVSQDPVVIYQQPGAYSVKLTVANAIGEHSVEMTDYVVVEEVPEADFNFMVDEMLVEFFNASSSSNYMEWDFGDGEFSFENDPVHIYEQGGIYNVTLTVANSGCGSAISKQVMIEQLTAAGEEQFISSVSLYPNPATDIVRIEMDQVPPVGTVVKSYDVHGKPWVSEKMNGRGVSLDVTGLPPGLYIISIENEEWQRQFRVVKN